jgi:BirA family transcriptional regulator, biotin operon repressor / biotin---[acetyl-CoA-carboxylase] ligase
MATGTAILEVFYQAAGQFVAAHDLAKLAHTSPVGVTGEILALEQLGYHIESHPHFGYRLLGTPDRLTADDIQARLPAGTLGSQVLVFEETSSTNDVVERMAPSQVGEGLVVFAESQTKGRGRHGRTWISPRGKGLWFSVLLRPKFKPAAAARITVAASVAVAHAIQKTTGLDARIKWPNDVTIGGKKVAGILTELRAEGDEIGAAILGIGIDVNCRLEEIPAVIATSLLIETGQSQDRLVLAVQVLSALDHFYRADFDMVVAEWARLSTTLGRQLVVTMGARRVEGHAQALDGDGALLLRRDNGQIERILSADVTVEK